MDLQGGRNAQEEGEKPRYHQDTVRGHKLGPGVTFVLVFIPELDGLFLPLNLIPHMSPLCSGSWEVDFNDTYLHIPFSLVCG